MNTRTIVFTESYAEVTYLPAKRRLILIWNGNPIGDEYKKPFLAMLEFGKEFPVDSMVSDISNQGNISPENRKWFEKELMPRGAEAGLKRAAIITNGSALKLYYANILLIALKGFPLVTRIFNSKNEAINWLDSFPVSRHK